MDSYFKLPKLYVIENITTKEVVNKIDRFQAIFRKVYELGWWYMNVIQTDVGTQFTSKEFQEGIYINVVQLALATPYHQ